MTPYEIGVLLWYYGHADDHPHCVENPPGWRPTIDGFLRDEVMRSRREGDTLQRCYMLTARGEAFVDALRSVPLPEASWIVKWPHMGGERA